MVLVFKMDFWAGAMACDLIAKTRSFHFAVNPKHRRIAA